MTELKELKEFIKNRFPVGSVIWDSTCSQPYTINKRTVYWVKPWTYDGYNDEEDDEEEDEDD